MSLVIAGTIRVPAEKLDRFRPHMQAMLDASRGEDGCLLYSYAIDVEDAGLVRVFEAWRDRAALDAHLQTAHLAAWRATWPDFGVSDRRLIAYEVSSEQPL